MSETGSCKRPSRCFVLFMQQTFVRMFLITAHSRHSQNRPVPYSTPFFALYGNNIYEDLLSRREVRTCSLQRDHFQQTLSCGRGRDNDAEVDRSVNAAFSKSHPNIWSRIYGSARLVKREVSAHYQRRQIFSRTIGAVGLHENAF